MGYARLAGGRVVLLMDGAAPPGGAAALRRARGDARLRDERRPPAAGGQRRPGAAFGGDWTLVARQTAAQSAVEVDGRSSARFEAPGLAARTFGARLVDGPALVSVRQAQDATGQWLLATQDGYVASHGLLQERRLFVDARGQELRGEDILTVADARARGQFDRLARDGRLGFAARFHLHPAVAPELDAARQLVAADAARRARSGCSAPAAARSTLEESVYFDPGAPRRRCPTHAGGCPRRGGRVSRPDHLVLRPHRRGARRGLSVTDPAREEAAADVPPTSCRSAAR